MLQNFIGSECSNKLFNYSGQAIIAFCLSVSQCSCVCADSMIWGAGSKFQRSKYGRRVFRTELKDNVINISAASAISSDNIHKRGGEGKVSSETLKVKRVGEIYLPAKKCLTWKEAWVGWPVFEIERDPMCPFRPRVKGVSFNQVLSSRNDCKWWHLSHPHFDTNTSSITRPFWDQSKNDTEWTNPSWLFQPNGLTMAFHESYFTLSIDLWDWMKHSVDWYDRSRRYQNWDSGLARHEERAYQIVSALGGKKLSSQDLLQEVQALINDMDDTFLGRHKQNLKRASPKHTRIRTLGSEGRWTSSCCSRINLYIRPWSRRAPCVLFREYIIGFKCPESFLLFGRDRTFWKKTAFLFPQFHWSLVSVQRSNSLEALGHISQKPLHRDSAPLEWFNLAWV